MYCAFTVQKVLKIFLIEEKMTIFRQRKMSITDGDNTAPFICSEASQKVSYTTPTGCLQGCHRMFDDIGA